MDEFTLEEFVAKAKDQLDDMLVHYRELTGDSAETHTAEEWTEQLLNAIHNS
jgi:hypothetical protein